jgi:hypothetical protein
MKRISILGRVLVQTFMLTLISGACGIQATPTVKSADVENTMVSDIVTMLAETHAAIPTDTLPPPTATITATNTPAATPTLPPPPTLGATFTALPPGNSGVTDPCINQVLPATLAGEKIRIRVDNPTRATLMISVYLQQAGPQSECGYRGYTLAPGESLVINDLIVGCYTLWAWNPDPVDYFIVTNGTSCLDTTNSWTFDISANDIRLRP